MERENYMDSDDEEILANRPPREKQIRHKFDEEAVDKATCRVKSMQLGDSVESHGVNGTEHDNISNVSTEERKHFTVMSRWSTKDEEEGLKYIVHLLNEVVDTSHVNPAELVEDSCCDIGLFDILLTDKEAELLAGKDSIDDVRCEIEEIIEFC